MERTTTILYRLLILVVIGLVGVNVFLLIRSNAFSPTAEDEGHGDHGKHIEYEDIAVDESSRDLLLDILEQPSDYEGQELTLTLPIYAYQGEYTVGIVEEREEEYILTGISCEFLPNVSTDTVENGDVVSVTGRLTSHNEVHGDHTHLKIKLAEASISK